MDNKLNKKTAGTLMPLKAIVPMIAMAAPFAAPMTSALSRSASMSRYGLNKRAVVSQVEQGSRPAGVKAFSAFGGNADSRLVSRSVNQDALAFLADNDFLSPGVEKAGQKSGDIQGLAGRKVFLSCTKGGSPAYNPNDNGYQFLTSSNCTSHPDRNNWVPGQDRQKPQFATDTSDPNREVLQDMTIAVGASGTQLFEVLDVNVTGLTYSIFSDNESAVRARDITISEESRPGVRVESRFTVNNVLAGGGANITVTATDPAGNFRSRTILIDTGPAPAAAVEMTGGDTAVKVIVLEDSGLNGLTLSAFAATFADAGSTLIWSASGGTKGTGAARGIVATPATNANPMSVSYTPTANLNGSDAFTVSVSDGSNTDSRTVEVEITPVNDEPTISALTDQTFNGVGGSAQTVADFASMSSTGGGADESSQTVEEYVVSEVSDPNGVVSSVSIASNGTLTYTPAANVEGVARIQAQVRDDGGFDPLIGDDNLSEAKTFTITVDTLAPSLSEVTAVTSPTGDSTPDVTINVSQAGTLAVGGSCGSANQGAVEAGNQTITLTQSDNSTPLVDGTYSDCTVTVTDANGNASSALTLRAFQIQSDSIAPVISEITPIVTGFGYTNDDTPNYTLNSDEAGTISFTGSCGVATPTTVLSGDTTITFAQLNEGSYSDCALKVTDAAGNESNALNLATFTVDTTAPLVQTVTAADVNTASTAASYSFTVTYTDPTYNLISPNQTASVNDVTVQDSSGNPLTVTSAVWGGQSPGSPQFATYTVTPPGGTWDSSDDGTYNISVNGGQVTDYAGNFVPATANAGSFSVDVTAPTLAEVTVVNTPTNNATPSYTFSATEAGTIAYAGGCSSSTTSATLGNNTVTFDSLAEGTYAGCTLTLTDAVGNTSDVLSVSSFVIDATAPVISSGTSVSLEEATTLSFDLTATDSVTPTPVFSLTGTNPSWVTLINNSLGGTAPSVALNTDVTVNIQALDQAGNSTTGTVTLTIIDSELKVITDAAGSANTITFTQLNAVDGVAGAVEANESFYQAAIAAGSASDFDTAAEIQAVVSSINASVDSVPVFTSINSLNLVEGEALNHALTATDAASDTLTFSLKAGSPSWLSVSGSTLSGTVPDPSGDSEVFIATVIVDDGFGNTVEQAISITVLDAEIGVISNAAGSANTITSTQLNAVDGVSGSLAANESYYQAAIAAGSASDFDTATEIQSMVTAVNASVASVPAFTSASSFNLVEGEAFSHALTATDAANDALIFSLKAGSPSWLSVSGSTLSGTVPDPTGDTQVFTATVIVDDGFGNTVEQEISITVVDAEINVISTAAGADNTITFTQLNAVDGVSGSLAVNESYYQAAIAAGSASDFDTAAEIQAMVTAVNASVTSVPAFTSINSFDVVEGEVLNHALTATDAASDTLTFSLKAGSPSWLSVSGSTLSGTVLDPSGDSEAFTATVIVDDGFGNTVEQAISITVLDAEVKVITDAAGSANTINSTQLNAVDGVSGAVVGNESYYQAAIAAGSAGDFDTAAEIQAMVTAVNASVASVPEFTSVNSLSVIEGEALSHALTATDAANDALTFSLKAGSPSWLSVSGSTLSGTVPDPSGDTQVFTATVVVDDGFGNLVEQEISITVVDAEVNVISTAAGTDNAITFTQLNAVDGVSGALEANEALYQAAIEAGSASDFDTAAEIQAMVTSVNTVPVFTSVNSVEVVEGEALSHALTATDAASDALTFSLKEGSPSWLSVSGSTLSGTVPDPTGDSEVFAATVIVDDGFGNTVEQEISITVLDAEVNAITEAAGATNSITFTQLNAVDGVTGALETNQALYQAAIAAGSASDFDTAAEIQAMVNRVNSQASVPVITSTSTLDAVVDQTVSFDLTATDAASDTLVFSIQSGLPSWLTLTSNATGVQQLTGTPSIGDVGVVTAVIEVTDGFTPVTQTLTINVNALAAITIYGRPVVANSLTTDVTDGNGVTSASFTYAWFVDGAPVPGETDSGYLVRESDLGKSIRVDVTFTDDDGLDNSATNTVGPVISIEQNAWNNITDSVGAVSAAPTFDDYRNVGLSDLTDDELTRILSILNRAVNQQAADGDIDELSELEALVDVILEGQDDDLDGLPNMLEDDGLVDTDRDGIDDRDDVDADNDGIRDNLEIDALVDMADDDSDGIVNLFDFDVDGDGYPDFKDYTDANLNGVIDEFETLSGFIAAFVPTPAVTAPVVSAAALAPVAAKTAEVDTDGDGIINSLDIDADGDGVFDLTEAGLPDADENALVDSGTALIDDYADLPDTDSDGIADFLQLKSNGTDTDLSLGGVLAALDLDLDGMIDITTDVDLDGLADVVDNAIGAFGSAKDFDGDGIPNHLDPDDDNDNISDIEENAELAQFFTGEDADGDGIDDGFDAEINGVTFGTDANGNGVRDDRELPDLDGDGLVDYLDDDADGDGIRDDIDDEIALPVQLAPGATLDDLDGDGVLDTVDPSVNTDIDVKTASKGSMSLGILFLLAGALVLMRRRTRLLVAMPLAIVAGHSQAADSQAADGEPQSSNFSFVTSVGLTKFDTDLADTVELTDENSAGFVFGFGYQLTDELAAEATYGILGKAGVNTGWVDYSSLALYLQYRPELVSYGKLRGQFKLGMNRVFYDEADGLNIDNKSADVLTFAVGADYEVNGTDAVEFMFTSFAEDVRFYSVGYRHNF